MEELIPTASRLRATVLSGFLGAASLAQSPLEWSLHEAAIERELAQA